MTIDEALAELGVAGKALKVAKKKQKKSDDDLIFAQRELDVAAVEFKNKTAQFLTVVQTEDPAAAMMTGK